jgi:hypothetical protein
VIKTYFQRIFLHLFANILATVIFYAFIGIDDSRAVTIEPECPVCPAIAPEQDTLEFVNEVLQFVATNADIGHLDNSVLDSVMRNTPGKFPAQQLMDEMCRNRATASCWHAAHIMTNILLENGIDAYTYDFGFANIELGHAMVLVKWHGKHLIFDPFLNYHMVDTLGQPIGLEEVLRNALNPDFRVEYRSVPVFADLTMEAHVLDSMRHQKYSDDCLAWASNFEKISENVVQKKFKRRFDNELNSPCPTFVKRFLTKLRYSTTLKEFHQGMLIKTHTVRGAKDHMKVDSTLYSIIRDIGPKWGYTN